MGGFFKWHLKPKAHRVEAYQKRIKQLRTETHQNINQKNKQGGHLHRLRLFSGDRIVRVTGRAGLGPGAGKSTTNIY